MGIRLTAKAFAPGHSRPPPNISAASSVFNITLSTMGVNQHVGHLTSLTGEK
jgi:hypothetical protein